MMSNSRTGKDMDKSSVTNTFNKMLTYDIGETALFSGFLVIRRPYVHIL
jgi:hypothetical protein